jgi:hypothetical protein
MKLTWPLVAVLFAVALLAGGAYLATRQTATSRNERDRNNSQPGSAVDPSHKISPSLAAEKLPDRHTSAPRDHNISTSSDQDESRDFSGVTTIDPAKPTPSAPPEATPASKKKSTAPLPLVFQPVDPRSFKITPDQQEVIDQLQQSFLDEIGGDNQNPNDPQYRVRWEQARWLIDQKLKAQLGQQFFLQYQMAPGEEK